MTKEETQPVDIQILGRHYKILCRSDQTETLQKAAQRLNREMQKIRDQGRTFGNERIAIMAALNIAHELDDLLSQHQAMKKSLSQKLGNLRQHIQTVLSEDSSI